MADISSETWQNATVDSSNISEWDHQYASAITTIGIGLTTSVCILGSIGNFLSVWVMLTMIKQDEAKRPINFILAALVTCDGLILVLNLFVNIISNGFEYTHFMFTFHFYRYNGYIAIALWPLIMTIQVTSINLTVLISYERWLAICRPFRSLGTGFKKHILYLMIIAIAESFLYNLPRWWEYEYYEKLLPDEVRSIVCEQFNQTCPYETMIDLRKSTVGEHIVYRYLYGATSYAIFVFFGPFICLAWTNRQLLKTIHESKKKWLHVSHSQRREVRQTKTPLAVMTLFYIFGLPAVFTQLFEAIFFREIREPNFWLLFLTISNLFIIINCSTNFIVYCVYGQKFRRTFVNLITCRKKQTTLRNLTWRSRTLDYRSAMYSRRYNETSYNGT